MRISVLLISFLSLWLVMPLYSQSKAKAPEKKSAYITRYFYTGWYNKEKKSWYFSKPKSILRLKKNGQHEKQPVFIDNEIFFIVTFNSKGRVVRVLKLSYWLRRSGRYHTPLEIYSVEHYSSNGYLEKRATYHQNVGMKYLHKVEHFNPKEQLTSEEYYKDGKAVPKKELKEK